MKVTREEIYAKSDGFCWYCGDPLGTKWQKDHVHPKVEGGSDDLDNLVPSCAPCNSLKLWYTVEQFRHIIEQQVSRARRYSVNFRTAERYGLIEIIDKPVVFWFEE